MDILPIDSTSGVWFAVRDYCEGRIAALTETCTSTSVTDEQRREAAHRIEELRDLLSAPARAKAATEHRMSQLNTVY